MTQSDLGAPDAAFSDLDWQTAIIEAAFMEAGYDSVEPPILQPAEVFLNRSGEDIRRRMYVFTDPGGEEVCLRPDLTIPTCRLYLGDNPQARKSAKLCYAGVAFRFQDKTSDRPTEFLQAGIESIGARDKEKADADALALIVEACGRVGLTKYKIKIGDVGLFFDLIDALDIPEQWRFRLGHSIWHTGEFEKLLTRYAGKGKAGAQTSALLSALSELPEQEARAAIEDVMDLAGIAPVGGRSMEEITERMLAQAEDARAEPLSPKIVKLLNDYLKIQGAPKAAIQKIRALTKKVGVNIDKSLTRFEKRLSLLEKAGVALASLSFDSDFGRNMEYYTGFVFELTVPGLGEAGQVAGGGRYDTLLKQLGAPREVPAVGAMIRTERLLDAIGGEA